MNGIRKKKLSDAGKPPIGKSTVKVILDKTHNMPLSAMQRTIQTAEDSHSANGAYCNERSKSTAEQSQLLPGSKQSEGRKRTNRRNLETLLNQTESSDTLQLFKKSKLKGLILSNESKSLPSLQLRSFQQSQLLKLKKPDLSPFTISENDLLIS